MVSREPRALPFGNFQVMRSAHASLSREGAHRSEAGCRPASAIVSRLNTKRNFVHAVFPSPQKPRKFEYSESLRLDAADDPQRTRIDYDIGNGRVGGQVFFWGTEP